MHDPDTENPLLALFRFLDEILSSLRKQNMVCMCIAYIGKKNAGTLINGCYVLLDEAHCNNISFTSISTVYV